MKATSIDVSEVVAGVVSILKRNVVPNPGNLPFDMDEHDHSQPGGERNLADSAYGAGASSAGASGFRASDRCARTLHTRGPSA